MIHTVSETGSTNEDAAAFARQGAEEGFWLRAERQSGGKGRQGRIWLSPPGNLYASTIVRLRAADPPASSLALVAAIALHDCVGPLAPQARIKWPNDLVAGDHKLAGILLEREEDVVIAGFGVNLAATPAGLNRPATSLLDLTGRAPDPSGFAEELAAVFAWWLSQWRRDEFAPIIQAWLDRAHPVGTKLATADEEGLFDGLDPGGGLRLRLADGSCRVIHAGDIFLI